MADSRAGAGKVKDELVPESKELCSKNDGDESKGQSQLEKTPTGTNLSSKINDSNR